VAHAKIAGLREHYGIDGGPAAAFFEVHGELDVEHSAAERHIVAAAPEGESEAILEATAEALDAWWDFLTAVDAPAAAALSS
jgi:pyrroloquinoline quinone (PQQ) biosynthesis protein C